MRSECDRTRLISELASLLRDCELPEEARHAGLTLIGWLARRMPGETASTVGVDQAELQHSHRSSCSHGRVASEQLAVAMSKAQPVSRANANGETPANGRVHVGVVTQLRATIVQARKAR